MKLTLEKILQLVAEEMTRRQHGKLTAIKKLKNQEYIRSHRVEENLKLLKAEIKPSPKNLDESLWFKTCGYYKPFNDYDDIKSFPDKIVILANTKDAEGNDLLFKLINPAVESKSVSEILLSIKEKQLEDTYIIYKGVIQNFTIREDRVIFDDVLIVEEEECPEDKETKANSKRKLAQIKKLEILEDMIDEKIDDLKEFKAMIHSLKSGKW